VGDYSALNSMAPAEVSVSADASSRDGNTATKIVLTNNSDHVAFFLRVEITRGEDGEEILPISYEDNYITLFPHESKTIQAHYQDAALSGHTPALRLEGYNVGKRIAAIHAGMTQ
jgi:exo-1,4-beta-D-glucosaminidase